MMLFFQDASCLVFFHIFVFLVKRTSSQMIKHVYDPSHLESESADTI